MTINFNDIIDIINQGGIEKVIKLRDSLSCIINDFKNKEIITVEILNRSGNITKKIKEKFPNFNCYWRPGETEGTIGTNIIYIPSEMWNDKIRDEISKFDDFVGHHVEKHQAYQLKKDIEIPSYIKDKIEYGISLKNRRNQEVNIYDIKIDAWPLKNTLRINDDDILKYFNEVTVVDREWDNILYVYDDRKNSERDIERFKNYIIEL